MPSDDEIGSHMLVGGGVKVHVIGSEENWALREVKSVLKGRIATPPVTTDDGGVDGPSCRRWCVFFVFAS